MNEKPNKVKPLSPDEVIEHAENEIPDVVIRAVNNLLKKEYKGSTVDILQDDIIDEILKLDSSYSREYIFEKGWLEFESLFRKAGWVVEYDKPGYGDNYKASFKFSKKRV